MGSVNGLTASAAAIHTKLSSAFTSLRFALAILEWWDAPAILRW